MTLGTGGRAAAAAGLLLLLLGVPGAAAEEPASGGCPVVAVAQGVQLMSSASDNLLLQAPLGAGVPVSQSCVDYGVRESAGFASSPYPGEAVLSAPGLVRGANEVPVPDYPAHVASRYPSTPESSYEQQGNSLRSRSSQTASSAQARSGLGTDAASVGSTATSAESSVNPSAGSAAAVARSDTQPLTVNEVLQLGRVRSVATARVGRDGKLQRQTELTVGRTTVAGQAIEITPDGVKAADQSIAVPEADPVDALEEAGVRVRYLHAEQTSRGVVSAGIEVRARQQDEQTGAVYTVHYVLGRSFASAVAPEDGPAADAERAIPPVGVGDSGTAETDVPQVGDVAPGGGPVPADAPAMAKAPEAAEDLTPQVATPGVRPAGLPVDMGAVGLYLVIAIGAVAMFVSGTLLRLLGVRTRWTN